MVQTMIRNGVTFTTSHLIDAITYVMVTSETLLQGKYGTINDEQRECLTVIHTSAVETFRRSQQAIRRFEQNGAEALAKYTHDWLTPSANALSYTDYMVSGDAGPMSHMIRQRVQHLYDKAHYIRRQTINLLDYAWIENGNTSPLKTFRLAEILHPHMLHYPNAVDLHWRMSPDLPPVRSSKLYITRSMENLLDNAFSFTQSGYVRVMIDNVGKHIEITLQDTGSGIPYNEQPHIFEPFRKVDPKRRSFGLGLTIARAFIEAQGSLLRLKSDPGAGSTFTFTVPIDQSYRMV